ncbi:tyrosine-type recombinase/integrase [Roseinatronobacter alkalisoli]|uniref:Tyrosine-type recombinase/integrase n=1 Tax=Roseinatronobacter alkalisoli TaxID=3028235 RepID=A0ABT5TFE2_9RHOB|nr:tyrosine-type recombinase/integrase [Roseinatronobacter sp. HJB301]MDD7973415.1 tyrosine-type recombinase/integrase [Roseinatronobacter sp. HJB301]
MNSPSNSPLGGRADADDRALVHAYFADNPRLSKGALSAARHFLKWTRARKIPIRDLDASVVGRFLRHRCRCGRYSPTQLKCPAYAVDTRRFLRYLEVSGVVMIADDVARLGQYLQAYAGKLSAARYSEVTYLIRLSQARHFAEWALQMRVPAHGIDDAIIDQFAHHDCRCGIKTKRGKRVSGSGTKDRRRGARAFVRFLRDQGLIPPEAPACITACDPRLTEFSEWLRRERGGTAETVRRYLTEAGRWLDRLGVTPKDYNAAGIRSIVLDQGEERSRSSVRMTVTVLRTFLRFTIIQGECAPSLLHAVPPAVRRKLSTVPRTIPIATVEEIIASCRTDTPVEIRDHAILLLLARLALRAGDIWQLRLPDIDWRTSRLRLHGKGRRGVLMPLPQDAGDALLAYIEDARPVVATDRVFLRTQAPFTPLRSAAEIAGIVSRVLNRGGFTGLPTGSHVFRHSLASAWLRGGADLDQIGVALRHTSRDTTAIYAKVDVEMLADVAQPWPGCAS